MLSRARIILLPLVCLISGCATSLIYGAEVSSNRVQIDAYPHTAVSYMVSQMPRFERDVSGHLVFDGHEHYSASGLKASYASHRAGLSWLIAYAARHDKLPTSVEHTSIAANTLKRGIYCDSFDRSHTQREAFVSPGRVLYEFASLETGGHAPRKLRRGCVRNKYVTPTKDMQDSFWPLPVLSRTEWISGAERLGFDCKGGSAPATCSASIVTLETTFKSNDKHAPPQARQYRVSRQVMEIGVSDDEHPQIVFSDFQMKEFDPSERNEALQFRAKSQRDLGIPSRQ